MSLDSGSPILVNCRRFKRPFAIQSNPLLPALDPYHYTSGRWLHREEEHQRARYIKFDLNALCRKAIEACPGASRVVNYEKKEGGFNRVFILHLDNGAKVVARVPFRLAGPPALVTHSEVATIAYDKCHFQFHISAPMLT